MARLFDEHLKRTVRSLNGFWRFQTDPLDIGEKEGWQALFAHGEHVTVPSVWNTEMGLLEYEGAAWYRKEFFSEGGCLRFCFDGVMTAADVWLDGVHLGSHYGGFCEFDFIVRGVLPGKHLLAVRADNRFDQQSIPQKHVDWFHYGGVPRDVRVETLRGICVLYHRMDYKLHDDMCSADCIFTVEIYNAETVKMSSLLEIRLGESLVYSEPVTLEAGERLEFTVPPFCAEQLNLWEPEKPTLYSVSFNTDTDDLIDRVGFRDVHVEHGRIYLNGRALELRGVNRHEEHPDWGFAFPQNLMKRDLDIIEELGCNAIRGSHYPNSRVFVDLLDERGILFWSEIPIWGCGFSKEALGDPVVVERGLQMHREMVRCYYNHPCVIIWGMHNEIKTDTKEAYALSLQYYRFLKENGGNRLVTYASNDPLHDICFAFCDFISINAYFGWYSKKAEKWNSFLEEIRERRDALDVSEKPVVFSEFGAAALYGHHTFDHVLWSEEYQASLLSYCLNLFHQDAMVAGFYVWQFCDVRTCREAGINRARGFNNKGLLNEYRKPKAAFWAVRERYRNFEAEENAHGESDLSALREGQNDYSQ